MFPFKLCYNCVSNKGFLILKTVLIKQTAFKSFYKLTSSHQFLFIKLFKGFTKLLLYFCARLYMYTYISNV